MDRLWTPWRMQYVAGGVAPARGECVLCLLPKQNDDRANLLLHRARHCYIVLNLYPYNTGHLMVAPYRHVPDLEQLSAEELADLFEAVRLGQRAVRQTMHPEGFNIGLNIGAVAGAGIPGHVHAHVVPRWAGDTNFMPVVGATKVLPELLEATYDKLKAVIG